ncbi:MAG: sulfotransferase [SAR202 cluster bacterium]|nr:sulfotransferase [SAR202 cluster bacterium]|tara:strand:+ start:2276 stop:3115 length:840 start_codon:yes stop_codon:yes gene_type:complete
MKPRFIGIGGQRCGTAWIYNCLDEHPELCLPQKELNFFVHDEKYTQGNSWYENQFGSCKSYALAGEMSSLYLYDDQAPDRIYHFDPNLLLIASIRNPAERTYSAYLNGIAAGEIPKELIFESALQQYPDLLEKSLYAPGLTRYKSYFGSKLLVVIYEELVANPEKSFTQIYEHLEVDPTFIPSMARVEVNVGRRPKSTWVDQQFNNAGDLARALNLRQLLRWAKKIGIVSKLREMNTQSSTETLSSETRKMLNDYFMKDIEELSNIVKKPLTSLWLKET